MTDGKRLTQMQVHIDTGPRVRPKTFGDDKSDDSDIQRLCGRRKLKKTAQLEELPYAPSSYFVRAIAASLPAFQNAETQWLTQDSR